MCRVPLIEFFENPDPGLLVHADSCIRERDMASAGVVDLDLSTGGCEFDGIADQVEPDLAQEFFISVTLKRFEFDIDLEYLALPLWF